VSRANNAAIRTTATTVRTPSSFSNGPTTVDRIARELYRLQAPAFGESMPLESGALPSPWQFSDGGPVRIVSGKLRATDLLPYASAADHNYMQLSAYADLDALIELFGHIRSLNPTSDVRYDLYMTATRAQTLRTTAKSWLISR
jgi:hypothetical protein